MRVEIIRNQGDLQREVWAFDLYVSYSQPQIYFDYYSFQTKETSRHKWKQQSNWSRLDSRTNRMGRPSIPQDIESEMRARYKETIDTMPIRSD